MFQEICYLIVIFVSFQWSDNPVPYAIYRTIVAAFFFIMVFYTSIYGVLGAKAAIMLTYWSFYILVACQILRAVNCWYYISLRKQGLGMLHSIALFS